MGFVEVVEMAFDSEVMYRERLFHRHAWLLGALLGFHVATPLVQMSAPAMRLFVVVPLYFVVLATATTTMSSRRNRVLLGVLATPMVAAAIASAVDTPNRALLLLASTTPFLAYAAAVVLRSVVAPGIVDRARLLGSASVFILAAQAWAGVYATLEVLSPGGFVVAGGAGVQPDDLAYFSFVTQTTLGYGDVTPGSPLTRAAATLHATAGLFFMGVIVARFAGRLNSPDSGRGAQAP